MMGVGGQRVSKYKHCMNDGSVIIDNNNAMLRCSLDAPLRGNRFAIVFVS